MCDPCERLPPIGQNFGSLCPSQVARFKILWSRCGLAIHKPIALTKMDSSNQWITRLNIVGFLGLVLAVTYFIPYQEISSSFSIAKIGSSVATTRSVVVDNLATEYRKGCPQHRFTSVRILSRAPNIILIEGFVTPTEAEFLVKIG